MTACGFCPRVSALWVPFRYEALLQDAFACAVQAALFAVAGIGYWNALPAGRAERFSPVHSRLRAHPAPQGRGSDAPGFTWRPLRDLTGRNSTQWKIRARSYVFQRRLLPGLVLRATRNLFWPRSRPEMGGSVIVLPAGHSPVAVRSAYQLTDGLGAAAIHAGARQECFAAAMNVAAAPKPSVEFGRDRRRRERGPAGQDDNDHHSGTEIEAKQICA